MDLVNMWNTRLKMWGYRRPQELAPILAEMNLCALCYDTPFQLAKAIQCRIDPETQMINIRGEWKPLAWYDPILDFLRWIWEQIAPWAVDVGLVALGAIITWLAGGMYKAIGVIPMGFGIYRILSRVGVI